MANLSTTDLWSQLPNHVGSDRHASLLDKLLACQSNEDERLIQLHEGGHTLEEIATIESWTLFDTQERFKRVMRRANGRHVGPQCCAPLKVKK